MKVRIVQRPTGLLNGQEWPEEGQTVDLPDGVAEAMIGAGHVEKAQGSSSSRPSTGQTEKRPAPAKRAEKRTAKKKA